jgi:dihydroneopterin aldolase
MRFHVRVGTLPHEAELPQPLEVDVSVDLVDGAGVLDYRQLYEVVSTVTSAEPLRFLEEVAARIADESLLLEGAAKVRVAVRKPHVPLPGPLAHAEIVIERSRSRND